jgi:hypothetical protein
MSDLHTHYTGNWNFKVRKIYITSLETPGQHRSLFCEFSLLGDKKVPLPLIQRIFVKKKVPKSPDFEELFF